MYLTFAALWIGAVAWGDATAAYVAKRQAAFTAVAAEKDATKRDQLADKRAKELEADVLALTGKQSWNREPTGTLYQPLLLDMGGDCVDGVGYSWSARPGAPVEGALVTTKALVLSRAKKPFDPTDVAVLVREAGFPIVCNDAAVTPLRPISGLKKPGYVVSAMTALNAQDDDGKPEPNFVFVLAVKGERLTALWRRIEFPKTDKDGFAQKTATEMLTILN